jgi:serine/threonine protein kinase/Tol biopolymer transport system component
MEKALDIGPDRWRDVSRIFAAAAGLEGPSRQTYLDGACQHDSALRAEVESLLGAHDKAGSFGNGPVLASATVKRLAPDSQLGPFRIESLLGAGGMGEVYRAYDTKLHRAVAIKVLPDSFAQDPNRLARFEEEARALAALNHPHIGAIYGVEESAGVAALVLELVEGPTLAERLTLGPLRFEEVVWIARQLAEGLEAAHERGIVHRDLKPANIKITPDGTVKILDFGLAKTARSLPGAPSTPSPATIAREATQFGMVLGTVGYMSPEQARGQPVDKRTDIWAFGCLLFEMCAHQPPFGGATISDAQAAVIEREPDWELLRAGTPTNLVRLLRRCLTKDPKLRLRDIGEARIAIETGEDTAIAHVPARSLTRLVAAVSIASTLVLAAVLGVVLYRTSAPRSRPAPPARFEVSPPQEGFFTFNPAQTFFAVSPDGSQLAFLASTESDPLLTGVNRIWVRAMSDPKAQPLNGTDGATSPFWSPDGRSLAFFADGKLKRIDLSAGSPVTVCDLPCAGLTNGTWGVSDPRDPAGAGGVILLGNIHGTSISAVAAGGGTPREIVIADQSKGEARVHWPTFLPDGKRFLYTVRLTNGDGELRLARLRIDDQELPQLDGSPQTLMPVSSNTQWIEPDTVLFVRESVLMAQRVNLKAAKTVGEPFSIANQVEYHFTTSRATFSASHSGSIAYHAGGDLKQLVWVDRNGNERETIGNPADYDNSTRLSHDGRVLLTARRRPGLGTLDIWRHNLIRGMEEQLTTGRGSELTPLLVDGERAIIFAGDSAGTVPHLYRRDLATGVEKPILPPGSQQLVMDLLPGGRSVAYAERQVGGFKIFQLPLTAGASPAPPAPLLPPHFNALGMRVSPDGRALAFLGGRGGRDLYVAPLPMTSDPELAARKVSSPPRWSADGRQLYYMDGQRSMMTILVRTSPSLTVGMPVKLFEVKRSASLAEVSSDGRFLLMVSLARASQNPIVVGTAAISSGRQ